MTSSKNNKFAAAVRNYVLDCISIEGENLVTQKQELEIFFESFKSEYCYPANVKRYKTLQNLLSEYLKGLPSTINIAFTYNDIEVLLREWGYIKENSSDVIIENELEKYWHYLAMALIFNFNSFKIDTNI